MSRPRISDKQLRRETYRSIGLIIFLSGRRESMKNLKANIIEEAGSEEETGIAFEERWRATRA
jgi:hypothetical protein